MIAENEENKEKEIKQKTNNTEELKPCMFEVTTNNIIFKNKK